MATILNASKLTRAKLSDHRVLIFGAGTAGYGIADRICDWMVLEGLTQKARSRFWLMESQGLLTQDRKKVDYFKAPYARPSNETQDWDTVGEFISHLDVVRNVKPTILIGTSTLHGAFTKDVVITMASGVERPIIFPLSNPISLTEATPRDILK